MENQIFNNAKEVLAYLQESGWKIKKSALYRHINEGKLRPGVDGFQLKAIGRYAKIFLKRLDGSGKAKPDKLVSLSERKLRAETLKLESQAKHWDLKARETAGEFMSREDVQEQFALRAIIFKANLLNFILTQSPELVKTCEGNEKKIDEFRAYFQNKAEDWMNELTKPIEWHVTIIEAPDDPETILASVTPGILSPEDDDETD